MLANASWYEMAVLLVLVLEFSLLERTLMYDASIAVEMTPSAGPRASNPRHLTVPDVVVNQ